MSKSIISVMQANGEGWACSNKPLSPLGGEQPEPDHEDRAITQLAGCLMASEGNTELDGRSDVFGWSPAYQSIVELHLSRELLMELYRELDGCVWRREDGGENRIAVCMANIKSALSPEPAKCGKCGGSVEVSGLTGGDRTAPLHWESRPCPACTEPAAPQGEDAPELAQVVNAISGHPGLQGLKAKFKEFKAERDALKAAPQGKAETEKTEQESKDYKRAWRNHMRVSEIQVEERNAEVVSLNNLKAKHRDELARLRGKTSVQVLRFQEERDAALAEVVKLKAPPSGAPDSILSQVASRLAWYAGNTTEERVEINGAKRLIESVRVSGEQLEDLADEIRDHRCSPVVSEEDLGLMNRSIAEHRDEANEHRLSGDYERQIEFELLADGLSALASRLAASRGGSDE